MSQQALHCGIRLQFSVKPLRLGGLCGSPDVMRKHMFEARAFIVINRCVTREEKAQSVVDGRMRCAVALGTIFWVLVQDPDYVGFNAMTHPFL
ncbi:hypothetical protein ANO14919_054360 [Xylariales sp. No.14919]|nr:hypothetical protein ANO14919_054360 [Xylariales sp. No.14919]